MTGNSPPRIPRISRSWKLLAPVALLLGVAAVDVLAMPAEFWAGDPFSWRAEARTILRDHRLSIDTDFATHTGGGDPGQYFVFNHVDGRWYVKQGLMNSLMCLPPTLIQSWIDGAAAPADLPPNLLIFNLYNVFLSVVVAGLLYGVTGRYSTRIVTRIIYVVACMYCTYLWYYQRAQGSEIVQTLFFLAYFLLLMKFLGQVQQLQGRVSRRAALVACGTWIFVLALALSRVINGMLIGLTVAAFVLCVMGMPGPQRLRAVRSYAALLILPAAVVLAVIGTINHVKFGSVWLTGYHQWRPQDHLPTGDWRDGVYGMLFSSQFSILLHFCPLILSLLAVRTFVLRHALDGKVIYLTFGAYLLVLGKIPTWRGEWTYGPRYMIFILPVLALPFLCFVDAILDQPRRWASWAAATAAVIVLGYSFYLQVQVNRLRFYSYYYLRQTIEGRMDGDLARYFYDRQLGSIYADLWAHRDNLEGSWLIGHLRGIVGDQSSVDDYRDYIKTILGQTNWYWESDTLQQRQDRPRHVPWSMLDRALAVNRRTGDRDRALPPAF